LSGNELLVKGDICIYDDWYNTRDRVSMSKTGELYYHGRT
jgi:acyl-coenzyme A synthetase/AMP-(fatty) acid ligase